MTETGQVARFGAFEVDLKTRELRKRGLKLKLQEKPFQILALLLEKPGQVVTRQELRERLWPPDIHVGFERSLNTAVNKLRQVLGDTAENPRFIETLARRGYCFIAPVERSGGVGAPDRPGAIETIAVLPFQKADGDPEKEYLGLGITESLIDALSRLPGVRVMALTTVVHFRGPNLDARAVGRELGVDAVLTGRLVERQDTLLIAAELVDTKRGWRLWGGQFQGNPSDLLALEEEVSQEIATRLRGRRFARERAAPLKRPAESGEAYYDYLKGRYHANRMTPDGLSKALDYFHRAIEKDHRYALAYAGLADAHVSAAFLSLQAPKEVFPQARNAALMALEIDDDLAEAHTALAQVKKFYDWDWLGAELEYKRALQLNPHSALAHRLYADYCLAMGWAQEALQEIRRALDLEPLSLVINMELAWNFYLTREYDLAAEQSLKTLEMEPGFTPAQYALGLAYEQLNRYEEAIFAFETTRSGSGNNPATLAALGHAYARVGKKQEALQVLRELQEMTARRYVAPYWPAVIHAGLGETDAALDHLEKSYAERDVWLVWFKAEPRFENLRASPRFQGLSQRMNFPP